MPCVNTVCMRHVYATSNPAPITHNSSARVTIIRDQYRSVTRTPMIWIHPPKPDSTPDPRQHSTQHRYMLLFASAAGGAGAAAVVVVVDVVVLFNVTFQHVCKSTESEWQHHVLSMPCSQARFWPGQTW